MFSESLIQSSAFLALFTDKFLHKRIHEEHSVEQYEAEAHTAVHLEAESHEEENDERENTQQEEAKLGMRNDGVFPIFIVNLEGREKIRRQ